MTSNYLYIARYFKNSVKNDQKTNYNYVKWSRQVAFYCYIWKLSILFCLPFSKIMYAVRWLWVWNVIFDLTRRDAITMFVDEQIKTRSNFKYDWHVHTSLKRFLFNFNMTDLFLYYTHVTLYNVQILYLWSFNMKPWIMF